MKKKLTALMLACALAAGLCCPALALSAEEAFPVKNAYPGFADVQDGAWYADTVKTCYEIGLMTGKDIGFDPDALMTLPEVAAIAARMNEAMTGQEIPAPAAGSAWYQPYVDHLLPIAAAAEDTFVQERLSAISGGGSAATRLEFVSLLALVTPEELLPAINTIQALPDADDPDVLAFYNAGILTGVDKFGTFSPGGSLSRKEAAAMVARIARPELRQAFTPAEAAGPSDPGGQTGPATGQTPFEQTLLDITDYVYTESDLQTLCEYAGLKADDVMVQIEGYPDITAKYYVGLLLDFCFRMDSNALEAGYESPWGLSWTLDGVSLPGPDHCKRLVLNMCVKTAMFMENADTSYDTQSIQAFRATHTVTETQLVRDLDVEAFHKASQMLRP